MKKKVLGLLLSTAMIASMLVGCGDKEEPVTNGSTVESKDEETSQVANLPESNGYTGALEVMHFSTSEESQGNGGSDGFRTVIAEWKKANPSITLEEQVLANAEYKTQIATLASADDLPDIFLLQGMNTITWAEQGLIMDMTDIIKSSPYYADYNQAFFAPFEADGKIYGLPALTGGSCTVVVYDKSVWGDTFPTTWDEVEAKAADMNVTPIAFGNGGKWQANSCFLSTLGDRYTGSDWFLSLIRKEGAAFTDLEFVAALTETQRLFTKTDIFNKDFNAITNEDAREYYISGQAAAFIGGNWDVSYIQASLEGTDLYDNTGFAVLPQSSDAKNQRNSQNLGLGYAVAINAKLADDPEKLAAAIDFAYYVTGSAFANFVTDKYALSGLTAAGDVDWSKFDQWTTDFFNWSYADTQSCEIYDSYINGAVWDVLNTELQSMMNGSLTPEKVAEDAQAAYEANY